MGFEGFFLWKGGLDEGENEVKHMNFKIAVKIIENSMKNAMISFETVIIQMGFGISLWKDNDELFYPVL